MAIRALSDITATITLGTPTAGAFPVLVQLLNASEHDVNHAYVVGYYLSSDAAGDVLCIDGTDTSDITILTDGTIIAETVADVAGIVKSETDGDIGFTVTVLTTKKAHLVIVLPDGEQVIGAEMAYTA